MKKRPSKKTQSLLDEFFGLLQEKMLSPEAVAFYVGVNFREIYRWKNREHIPDALSRRAIARAIKRIRKLPDIRFEALLNDRTIYRSLKARLSIEEKEHLFDALTIGEYRRRLNHLRGKYADELSELSDEARS